MTDKEVMQMALETAEQIASADYRHWEELASLGEFERWARSRANHIAEALRTALAQLEPEPVAWYYAGSLVEPESVALDCDLLESEKANCLALYKTPPQRKPLSDEEIEAISEASVTNCYFDTITLARAIEAAHGIKEKL